MLKTKISIKLLAQTHGLGCGGAVRLFRNSAMVDAMPSVGAELEDAEHPTAADALTL